MRIGLYEVKPKSRARKGWDYPNIALGKIARFYRNQGAIVEWLNPLTHYDKVFVSKIFNFYNEDLPLMDADEVIFGGTGYDINSRLPEEIDRLQPDYSIFKDLPDNYAYGFLTRGCPNKCPWCVVPRKEGAIHPYMDIEDIAIEGRNHIVLMDNNILAAGDYCIEQFKKIIDKGYVVDFNQALDARLMTDKHARLMSQMKWIHHRIRFGCDTKPQIAECQKAIDLLMSYGYKGEFFLYTMIGGKSDFEESFSRVNYWHEKTRRFRQTKEGASVYSFAQPYRDPNNPNHKIPQWQKDLARWCNNKFFYGVCDFKDFEPRKGFKCIEYFKGNL